MRGLGRHSERTFRGRMGTIARHMVCGMLALLVVCLPTLARGQSPTLNRITLANTNDDLLLHLTLEGSFSEKIKRSILDGAPVSFVFIIRLNEVRDLWLDQQIADLTVVHTIRYDNMKREFVVRRSWKGSGAEVTSSFENAQEWMNQIENIKVIPLSRMAKGSRYQLLTKAEVSKKTLPWNLHTILFFMSFWDETTDWYIIDFTQAGNRARAQDAADRRPDP
jgi:hypothetical protein